MIKKYKIKNGFAFDFLSGKKYQIKYNFKIWENLPPDAQDNLADNFIYARTRQISLLTDQKLSYSFPRPQMADFADYGIIHDLGKIADMNNMPTQKLIQQFKKSGKQINYQKNNKNQKILPQKATQKNQMLLALSFGKDSLLTYGLIRELHIPHQIVFVKEMQDIDQVEAKHKNQICHQFIKNEKVQIEYMHDHADEIFLSKKLTRHLHDIENTNGMLAFILELLPVAYWHKCRYVVLGNEANFIDSFVNHDGHKSYPSFDQSIIYAKKHNQYLKKLTSNNLQSISLVEPIYNLAEYHILYHRYPDLLKYMMSCSPEKPGSERWCYDCPMCAKAFLYSKAVGGDPKAMAFNQDFFAKKYIHLYPIFAKKITRAYEKPQAVRDEQLLAFLLAYQQGHKGALIDLFARKYLKEAKRRQKSLRAKFFGLHNITTIPSAFKNKLLKIYAQELDSLKK